MLHKKEEIIEGIRISYRVEGKGPSLVLLHGWGVDGGVFMPIWRPLVKRGYSLLVPDFPGFGESSLPLASWGLEDYVRILELFLDKLKIKKFHLLGYSFGGRIALELAAKDFKKINSLTLTGVPIVRRGVFYRVFFLVLAKTGKIFFSLFPLNTLRKFSRRILYFLARERDYYNGSPVMRAVLKRVIGQDQRKILKLIKTPTLLIWGEKDRLAKLEDALYLEKKIPAAKLMVVKNGSHRCFGEKPKEFISYLLPFLKKNEF